MCVCACVHLMQGCTIYKQGDAVFIGRLLKGCDAEASGECLPGVVCRYSLIRTYHGGCFQGTIRRRKN